MSYSQFVLFQFLNSGLTLFFYIGQYQVGLELEV